MTHHDQIGQKHHCDQKSAIVRTSCGNNASRRLSNRKPDLRTRMYENQFYSHASLGQSRANITRQLDSLIQNAEIEGEEEDVGTQSSSAMAHKPLSDAWLTRSICNASSRLRKPKPPIFPPQVLSIDQLGNA